MTKKKTKLDPSLAEIILKKIESSGLSCYRIAKLSGVGTPTLSRFMSGSSLSLENADKLCKALGLHLVELKPKERYDA